MEVLGTPASLTSKAAAPKPGVRRGEPGMRIGRVQAQAEVHGGRMQRQTIQAAVQEG